MASELDQVLPQPQEQQKPLELQNEIQGNKTGFMLQVWNLKSFEILKSSVKIFTCNTKFMSFSILSIIPLFGFMLFYESKLENAVLLLNNLFIQLVTSDDYESYADNNEELITRSDLLQLCVFYTVFYPLLEVFSMIITTKMAAKIHAGETQVTLKDFLYQKINSLKGLFVTCLLVQLLSNSTLLGLISIVNNYRTLVLPFYFSPFSHLTSLKFCSRILFIAVHSVCFIALLYKYLVWSGYWNMGMVISILEEETGIRALWMSYYYGKHCKQTGFQLMVVLFAFGNFLRLNCLLLTGVMVGNVMVDAISIGLFCLVNLVKWVAFLLYFHDCKQQILGKKADEEEEVGKPRKTSDMFEI